MKSKERKVPPRLELRFHVNEELANARDFHPVKFPHISPDSVFVAAIGTGWKPGAWQKVTDMLEYTSQRGVSCWLREFDDGCVTLPFQALDSMRNLACVYANNMGFEWLLLIDNDILPEPDLLVRLLSKQLPILAPFIRRKSTRRSLSDPSYDSNIGVQLMAWSVFSCLLIWTKVLNCFPDCSPFTETKGEGPFFMKLLHFGHRAYIDTDTVLKTASQPTYPGDLKDLNELWELFERVDKTRRQLPNRSPIDPNSPNQRNGIYFPPSMMETLPPVSDETQETK